jgi:hypothetical protein
MNTHEEIVIKGTKFWTDELEKSGQKDSLRFFNDVITEKRIPHPDAGYGEPVLIDVMLDGKKCDVYHTDHNDRDTRSRLFIHIKE